MSTVEDILRAIARLSPEERWEVQQELQQMEGKEPLAGMPDTFWNQLEEIGEGR